ncbi:MAG: hypothetical protein D6753_17915 [Planctomycetota bacterium]|nr:MAG: hypothetical protein D6753_17915 [Planctomycetota bacterium]
MLVVAVVVWSADPMRCLGQDAVSRATSQSVLLTNQRVLHGSVSHNGNLITIDLLEGGRISIPKNQVQFIGQSLQDVYLHKRGKIRESQPGDHYQLARWCLVEGLLEEAISHYQRVAAVAGDHPRIRQLGVTIRQRVLDDPEFRDYLGLPHRQGPAATPPKESPVVQPAFFPADSAGAAEDSVALADGRAALEAALQNPNVTLAFSQSIQPILLNRCSQSACHGSGAANRWRIEPPFPGHESEVTERNLRATLNMLAASESLSKSPLLQHATHAHGTQREPAIAPTERSLVRQLETWIRATTSPVVPADASLAASQSSQLAPVSTNSVQLKEVPRNTSPLTPQGSSGISDLPTAAELDALEREIEREMARETATRGKPELVDPFDPDAFNRMKQ